MAFKNHMVMYKSKEFIKKKTIWENKDAAITKSKVENFENIVYNFLKKP